MNVPHGSDAARVLTFEKQGQVGPHKYQEADPDVPQERWCPIGETVMTSMCVEEDDEPHTTFVHFS